MLPVMPEGALRSITTQIGQERMASAVRKVSLIRATVLMIIWEGWQSAADPISELDRLRQSFYTEDLELID
jgi:hypothetical protein